MEWREVAKVHGTNAGISIKDGRIVSILCNTNKEGAYGDVIKGKSLTYHVPNKGVNHKRPNALGNLILLRRDLASPAEQPGIWRS